MRPKCFEVICRPDKEDRSEPTFGVIFIRVKGHIYPHLDWTDCCTRVLGGWLSNIALGSKKFTNFFMEGPYSFNVAKTDGNALIRAGDHRARMPWNQYVGVILDAASAYLIDLSEIYPVLRPEEMRFSDGLQRIKDGQRLFWDGKAKPRWVK